MQFQKKKSIGQQIFKGTPKAIYRRLVLLLYIVLMTKGFAIEASAQYKADINNYIQTYKDIAIGEMERTGIPASIKLAQGILESGAGKSELAVNANNHFGIKCGKDWLGKTYSREDDDYDTTGILIQSCFRAYTDATESYIAHSEFLRNPAKVSRYGFLFNIDPRDYKEWAIGLKRAGYATNPNYANLLIKTIEDYKLYEFDQVSVFDLASNDKSDNIQATTGSPTGTKAKRSINRLSTINDVRVVMVNDGSTIEELSQQYDVSVHALMKYNKEIKSKSETLAEKSMIFLQPRRNSYRGKNKWHYVKKGENIESIAKHYAIKETHLLRKNNLKKGEEPAIGEKLALRGWSIFNKKPILRSEKENILPPKPTKPNNQDQDHLTGTAPVSNAVATTAKPATNGVATNQTKKPADDSRWTYHQIEKGDTLYNLSKKYNTTIDQIKSLNNLGDEGIKIGQTIRVQ